jgi:hypothetical protein
MHKSVDWMSISIAPDVRYARERAKWNGKVRKMHPNYGKKDFAGAALAAGSDV